MEKLLLCQAPKLVSGTLAGHSTGHVFGQKSGVGGTGHYSLECPACPARREITVLRERKLHFGEI